MPRIVFYSPFSRAVSAAVLLAMLLAACGGGGGDSATTSPSPDPTSAAVAAPAPNTAPSATPTASQSAAAMATDGFNWVNYRRQQLGLTQLLRNTLIDNAARNHSEYQRLNNVITHEETRGAPGFTGVTTQDRLVAAGYRFPSSGYAYGEVISATGDRSGVDAAENLITAIYHRFVMFEPKFKEAGAGAAGNTSGYQYFTLDMATTDLSGGLGRGRIITYPAADQTGILTTFYSDYEEPDPVAGRNAVGYPVSVHADVGSTVTVASFTIAPHGGAALPVQQLAHASDDQTPSSAAAIVPLDVLAPSTTYDVQFVGTVGGIPVNRSWSFTTGTR